MKEAYDEGGKPGKQKQGCERSDAGSIQNKMNENKNRGRGSTFFILQRKNELGYEEKKYNAEGSCLYLSRLMKVDGKIKWQISLICCHQHQPKLTRPEVWIKARTLESWVEILTYQL